jgi:3-methyl-2-oxobutanoate hydroxymethyltransferase
MAALDELASRKYTGRKIVAVVAWDVQMARVADRVGVDLVSVGDSVGVNLWGRSAEADVTVEEMVLVAAAVRRGVRDAPLSCDLPVGTLAGGPVALVKAARRLVDEAGVDLVKLDEAADHLDGVAAVVSAGIPVWAQFEGGPDTDLLVRQARSLQDAGAALLDFKHSGPVAGALVTAAVSIPVLGGQGGGPWLDGRIRMAHAAIGYAASGLDSAPDAYANVAQIAYDALHCYAADVRSARHIRGDRA